uniref:GUN4-like domain-containing protein n=1 Tax=Dipterocladia arabiensis TaxID=2007176 RepID=A0A1Z1M039_9FLOR|nr:hypothetical protein [Dipterocladia arabiensis]ARW59299.1 hypothetical protein [Dipterocladia arabiensis]
MEKIENSLKNLFIFQDIDQVFNNNKIKISNKIIEDINYIINNKVEEQEKLINILIERILINQKNVTKLDEMIFDKLQSTKIIYIKKKINIAFNNNIKNIKLLGSLKLNYKPLQQLLIKQNFQEADKFTQNCLCQLANLEQKHKRNWLYFTDIALIPKNDLLMIDLLWQIYSNSKFGFIAQKKIWMKNNQNWDLFLEKIGWIENKIPKRYPKEFQWTIDAPKGHLPLFNQLRGTQVLYHLFKYI